MAASLEDLVTAVREASLPGPWSQGVKLARQGAVFDAVRDGDSVTARVEIPGAVAPTVTLYPADGEWTCDCEGKVDPCAHVAAAAIAVTQGLAKDRGAAPAPAPASTAVPTGSPAAAAATSRSIAQRTSQSISPTTSQAISRLRYELGRRDGALRLERWIVHPDGREEPLRGPIAAAAPRVSLRPTHEDVTIDRLIGARQFGHLPPDRVGEVFAALAGASDVRFEGRRVTASAEVIVPLAEVVDAPGGVALVIDRDPRVTEVLGAGLVLCGASVHRMGETDLGGGLLEKLPMRRMYPKSELATLVAKVLPDLRRRVPVDVKTRRLPESRKGARPRVLFQLDQRKHTLTVIPSLVYGDPPVARVEGGKLVHLRGAVPLRDEPAERELLARLRDELHLVPGRAVDFDGADAIRFAQKLEAWDSREGDGESRDLFGRLELTPRLRVDDRAFEVIFESETDADDDKAAQPRRADPEAVIRAFQDGLPLVPLEGGGFAPLPRAFLERHGQRVADLLAARQEDGKVSTAALPVLAELCDAMGEARPPSFEHLAPLLDGFDALPETGLPADLTAELRPYQRRGVDWLAFLQKAELGAVLADDMGLGKTVQTLAALRGRTLVVCPRSVVHNWEAEIRRFRPALRVSVYHGPRRELDPVADVTLTTYAILRLDAEVLAKAEWDGVVLDEAQAIKNQGSQVARAAYALPARHRVSLSGTPVENRLEELWSQMHFTNRGLLGSFRDFQDRYARPIEAGEPGAAARLRAKIKPFVLRRMKREVAPELPPRTDAVLYCELEQTEQDVYEAVLAATRSEIVGKLAEGGSVLRALEALLRLRQAACHPSLVPGQRADSSSKVERLLEALEDAAADGHKALVFSQWTSLLDLVEPHLQRAGIEFLRLDGSTQDRAGVVTRFQDPSGPPVMLVSLKAGGTGLNLTAADHVFLLDPWWNPAAEDQAADRAHRIGQDKPVMVYRLVAKDTVEERILALQEKKRSLADAALGEADRALGITREELLSLLE
jgi:superfamily II DNA or RNA helicase